MMYMSFCTKQNFTCNSSLQIRWSTGLQISHTFESESCADSIRFSPNAKFFIFEVRNRFGQIIVFDLVILKSLKSTVLLNIVLLEKLFQKIITISLFKICVCKY